MDRREFLKGLVSYCCGLSVAGDAIGGHALGCGNISDDTHPFVKMGFYIRAIKFKPDGDGCSCIFIGDRKKGDASEVSPIGFSFSTTFDGRRSENEACAEVVPFNSKKGFEAYDFLSKFLVGYDDVSLLFYRSGEELQLPYILQSTVWDRQHGVPDIDISYLQ